MTDSFRLRPVMTCADNISAVQHEKRVCRVKCTLHTQGQEATKTNGTTLTERMTRRQHGYEKNQKMKKLREKKQQHTIMQ